jgi:glutamate formiminotransferase/formiminotetrahydrofolate cyclodeaminase
MPTPLVECIPNFSEARRPEVVEAILQTMANTQGVHVLDRHSDLDHNRTVITLVGEPTQMEEAVFQAIAKAAQLIDLDHHTGEHPRIGATDVVPFVPISDMTMQDAVEIARRLGQRVGSELEIPVYLYEEAATRPDRHNLEDIRQGQYEVLKNEIATHPNRYPDFGPARMTGAGATVIGARQPLIAFNVYLTTDDIPAAQKIARAVRNSNGGLRYVKAMGILVNGRAQVSMNLTNYRQTPIARVVEMVRREAQRYGANIHHCELVGLAPQEALVDAARWYTGLDEFEPNQILETRLFDLLAEKNAPASSLQPHSFLDNLASGAPTPGGGSAAAYTAAMAAALVAMVARLTVGKKKYALVEAQMWEVLAQTEALRSELTQAVQQDAAAFELFMQASHLPKDTPEQQQVRAVAIQATSLHAAEVPLQVAGKTISVLKLAVIVASQGNLNAISDAGTAGALCQAAMAGAGLNIRTNTLNLSDQSLGQPLLEQLKTFENETSQLADQLKQTLSSRGQINF